MRVNIWIALALLPLLGRALGSRHHFSSSSGEEEDDTLSPSETEVSSGSDYESGRGEEELSDSESEIPRGHHLSYSDEEEAPDEEEPDEEDYDSENYGSDLEGATEEEEDLVSDSDGYLEDEEAAKSYAEEEDSDFEGGQEDDDSGGEEEEEVYPDKSNKYSSDYESDYEDRMEEVDSNDGDSIDHAGGQDEEEWSDAALTEDEQDQLIFNPQSTHLGQEPSGDDDDSFDEPVAFKDRDHNVDHVDDGYPSDYDEGAHIGDDYDQNISAEDEGRLPPRTYSQPTESSEEEAETVDRDNPVPSYSFAGPLAKQSYHPPQTAYHVDADTGLLLGMRRLEPKRYADLADSLAGAFRAREGNARFSLGPFLNQEMLLEAMTRLLQSSPQLMEQPRSHRERVLMEMVNVLSNLSKERQDTPLIEAVEIDYDQLARRLLPQLLA